MPKFVVCVLLGDIKFKSGLMKSMCKCYSLLLSHHGSLPTLTQRPPLHPCNSEILFSRNNDKLECVLFAESVEIYATLF